jgi:hypothetical protein
MNPTAAALSRRRFVSRAIRQAAAVGLGYRGLVLLPQGLGADRSPLRVAAIVTEFTHRSHAHVLLENFLEPYLFNGKLTVSGTRVSSLYVDQFPDAIITKSGEVIPAVVSVVLEKRPADALPFDFAAHTHGHCPACGSAVRRDPEFAVWVCENPACPAQKTRRLEYFAKRGALDLEGLGGIVADKLVERGLVSEPLEVFNLTLEQLATLNLGTNEEPRVFGEKNARKLIDAIAASLGRLEAQGGSPSS